MNISVVNTGTTNIASIVSALRRCGGRVQVVDKCQEVDDAERLVLPGVGTFGAAMEHLHKCGIINSLRSRVKMGIPTLAICLGFQLLYQSSEESPNESGLAVINGRVERFNRNVKVPHLGWNFVRPGDGSAYLQEGYAYFAHSYRVTEKREGWLGTLATYDGEFLAAVEKGRVLACQFHPELSGAWGLALLKRWIVQNEG